jgi:hypothetical protein
MARGFDLGTRTFPTQIAHDGTDASRHVLSDRFHENLLPSRAPGPDVILDEVSRLTA